MASANERLQELATDSTAIEEPSASAARNHSMVNVVWAVRASIPTSIAKVGIEQKGEWRRKLQCVRRA